jgi:hypothetical protein
MNIVNAIVGNDKVRVTLSYQEVLDYVSSAEGWAVISDEVDSFGYELEYANLSEGISICFVDGSHFTVHPFKLRGWEEL